MLEKMQKVLNGLEACLSDKYRFVSDNIKHEDCPYKNRKYGCIVKLHEDAYEVLCKCKEKLESGEGCI